MRIKNLANDLLRAALSECRQPWLLFEGVGLRFKVDLKLQTFNAVGANHDCCLVRCRIRFLADHLARPGQATPAEGTRSADMTRC